MNLTKLLKHYKETHQCIICGESDPCCLEFHHIFPNEKLFSLSKRLHRDVTIEEIKKYDKVKIESLSENQRSKWRIWLVEYSDWTVHYY